jgi:hypothetical protein
MKSDKEKLIVKNMTKSHNQIHSKYVNINFMSNLDDPKPIKRKIISKKHY